MLRGGALFCNQPARARISQGVRRALGVRCLPSSVLSMTHPDPTRAPLDLAVLVPRAARGDERAARALFAHHHRRVMAYCVLSADGDRDRAQDLAQEAFARAFDRLETLREPSRFGPWLMRITASICARRGAHNTRYQDALEAFRLEQGVVIDPDDKVERERRIARVRAVLSEIPDPTLRQIVTLKYTDPEHTTRQIAARLSIPHGTVTVKLMRFRAAIKRKLLTALAAPTPPQERAHDSA